MDQDIKAILKKYGACFLIASLIAFVIFWIKGFFNHSIAVNIQILSDGFSIAGMLFLFFAGMMFISGEGALIGIGFVLKSIAQAFVPMGRKNHELYRDYRERKLGKPKTPGDHCILITGLIFFAIGMIFTIIWYTKFYVKP